MSAATSVDDVVAEPILGSYVAGRWRDGGVVHEREDPAMPGRVVARTSQADRALGSEAVASARDAFEGWKREAPATRGAILRRAAALLEERAEGIGWDLAREEGKTRHEAVVETQRAAEILRYFAGQAAYEPDGEVFPGGPDAALLYARREPLGVVAAITPWNFPIAIPAWKLAPAVAYGNTVVWKPAELVPRTSVHLMRAFVDAGLPPGVVELLLGSGAELSDTLVGAPGVAAVTFTGSNAVGRRILASAASAGQRVQLELGGSNPSVVLADADLEHAAQAVARAAFMSAGQKCTATSRVIVEAPIYDAFTERLAAAADALVVGDPLDGAVDVGPLASGERAADVRAVIADVARTDRRITRRAPDDVPPGAFVAPTLFDGPASAGRLWREEVFGPVAAVVAADSYADALRLANDTAFGLSASIFTNDLSRALHFCREARAGTVKCNQESTGNEVHVPFGGVGASAYGPNEQGKAAREFFTSWKTAYIEGLMT